MNRLKENWFWILFVIYGLVLVLALFIVISVISNKFESDGGVGHTIGKFINDIKSEIE